VIDLHLASKRSLRPHKIALASKAELNLHSAEPHLSLVDSALSFQILLAPRDSLIQSENTEDTVSNRPTCMHLFLSYRAVLYSHETRLDASSGQNLESLFTMRKPLRKEAQVEAQVEALRPLTIITMKYLNSVLIIAFLGWTGYHNRLQCSMGSRPVNPQLWLGESRLEQTLIQPH
jgi:hypothetical protein